MILSLMVVSATGKKLEVRTSQELAKACEGLSPGDVLVIPDGNYRDLNLAFRGKGTEANPIFLRAETPGKVILSGKSTLTIGGDYLVVDGLTFRNGVLGGGAVVQFLKHRPSLASFCTLRNTAIIDYNPKKIETRYDWVSVSGNSNVVERCWFSGQSHLGVTLAVHLAGANANHVIRGNYFGNRPKGRGNGFETVRVGYSQNRMTSAGCVVSDNLFEKCDGEIEIISNKSSDNQYLRNTFLGCRGCLTLRVGNRCVIRENVFLRAKEGGAIGGIRVSGESHLIEGNYLSGTAGMAGGAVSLIAGIPNSHRTGYFQVRKCEIRDNVFVSNTGPIFCLDAGVGTKGRELLPQEVKVSRNLMISPRGAKPLIVSAREPTGIDWGKNIVIGGSLGAVQPKGMMLRKVVPRVLKKRLKPRVLKRKDVGPGWMRSKS